MANPYALGQLSQAFLTAVTHEDPEFRRAADQRAQAWARTIEEIASGRVQVGSRTPVEGLPAWVTLKVMRGGFASGQAMAEVPIEADEVAWAAKIGLPPSRGVLFAYFVTDAGLAELNSLLDSGRYRVDIPEDAALLTMAWMLRAGDRVGALQIIDEIQPFADRFRFAPKVTDAPATPVDFVHRSTAGQAMRILKSRKPKPQVEAQREALAVWNPFGDRVLELWLEKYDGHQISLDEDPAWRSRAAALVDEYDQLTSVHTRCTKHRNPKQNLAIMLRVLRMLASGATPTARDAGLARVAITSALAKRGAPGSAEHRDLRQRQHTVALEPAQNQVAAVAGARLEQVSPEVGLVDPEPYAVPVTPSEATESGVPAGSAMPAIVARTLRRAHSAPLEELMAEGLVPSAEVLAILVPGISSGVVAAGFDDPALARLAADNYRAFRRRRSLLLTNLNKQVQLIELPWVDAMSRHKNSAMDEAMATVYRVGALTFDHFPATIMPNPLVAELDYLLKSGSHVVPLVEELAADIFMGRFSDKFRRAAQVAMLVVGGTVYSRYYGIDVDQVMGLPEPQPDAATSPAQGRGTGEMTFSALCHIRAGRSPSDGWSTAGNGRVIEQSQVLTTHNLGVLVKAGTEPERPWVDLAREAITRTGELLTLAAKQPRPLTTVKDAAYAWRQGIFFLAVAPAEDQDALLADPSLATQGPQVMNELLDGLRAAARGDDLAGLPHVPFLGWSLGRHWILDAIGAP